MSPLDIIEVQDQYGEGWVKAVFIRWDLPLAEGFGWGACSITADDCRQLSEDFPAGLDCDTRITAHGYPDVRGIYTEEGEDFRTLKEPLVFTKTEGYWQPDPFQRVRVLADPEAGAWCDAVFLHDDLTVECSDLCGQDDDSIPEEDKDCVHEGICMVAGRHDPFWCVYRDPVNPDEYRLDTFCGNRIRYMPSEVPA